MSLTAQQLTELKNDILADPILNTEPATSDGDFAIATAYNLNASPDWWIWRTHVGQLEIVTTTTEDGTVWSWPAFIARSQGERDGWREMFADGGFVNASLANVRQGFLDIFSGAANSAPAQRTHLAAVGRKRASRIQKLFSSGVGTTSSPATLDSNINDGFILSFQDVNTARNS